MVLAVGRAQAVAQQNATWLNYGKVAEQALPVFRNVIEAITYALFPLFVLLLLLTSGRETTFAFKGYAAILIWIQLWPPLYAVLNYMASIYAAYDLAAAADLGTGAKALSLHTASTIYSRAISGEAIVGYLAISIPFIAWAALKRMENFGTALVGGLSGLQGMLSGSTGSAAVGNVNMGNVAMDQLQLAPNRTSAFMSSWQNDLTGNTASSNALTGRTAVSLLRNQGFASRVVSMKVSEQDVTEASRQADAARSEAVSATQDRSAVLAEAFTRGLTKLRSARSSSGSSSSGFEQFGETMNRLDQVTRSVADSTGLSQSQVASIDFGASAHLGLSSPVAGASIQGNAGKSYQSGLSEEQRKVLGSMTTEQIAEFKQFGDRVSRDASFITAVADDSREARELASRPSTTMARAQRAEASFAERTTRRQYDRERTSPLLNPDLTSSGRGNSRRVSGFGQSTPKIAEAPQPSVIRGEVEKRAAEIRQSTESSQGGFDTKAQIVRTPDGTLATKKSLLMQSGRQVSSDATESMDAAKEVAKDLLKRKK